MEQTHNMNVYEKVQKLEASARAPRKLTYLDHTFFSSGVNNLSLNANAELTNPVEFKIPTTSELLLQEIQIVGDQSAGVATHFGIKIFDSNENQYTYNTFVNSNFFSNGGTGHAERPMFLNILLSQGVSLFINVLNLTAAPYDNLSLLIAGRRLINNQCSFGYDWL